MTDLSPAPPTESTTPIPGGSPGAALTPEQVATLAEEFGRAAASAMASGDDAEVFNAALEFATRRDLTAAAMARVLVAVRQVLGQRNAVSAAALRSWIRDGREALGENRAEVFPDRFINTEIQLHAASAGRSSPGSPATFCV